MREGATGYVIRLCTILKLLVIKVKFYAASTSGFNQLVESQSWAQCFLSKGKGTCKGPVVGTSRVRVKIRAKTRMAGAGSRSGSLV